MPSIILDRGGSGRSERLSGDFPRDPVKRIPLSHLYEVRFLYTYIICFLDRKSTRLNSSHLVISYAVFCLKIEFTGVVFVVCVRCGGSVCVRGMGGGVG